MSGLLGLLGAGLAACGGGAGAPALPTTVLAASKGSGGIVPRAIGAGTMFTVVNLDPANSSASPAINAGNQVAFTVYRDWRMRAGYFNGDTVRDIGTFGGAEASAGALNDAGQVAGIATDADETPLGFRWSETTGLVSLGTLGAAALQPSAINRSGQLTGWASDADPAATPRAFFWSDGGARGLGSLSPDATMGEALNDAGMLAGTARTLAVSRTSGDRDHAFVWSAAAGMVELGTNGGANSSARLINNNGQVAGAVQVAGGNDMPYHGFVWSQATGMVDIGTLSGNSSYINAMNQVGQVAGGAHLGCGDCVHAITWSAATGQADLGVLGGVYSDAFAINERGEVVGWADTAASSGSFFHAVVWTREIGMVDLNQRLVNAPAGLELTAALAISDEGAIVADSNAGLVLLLLPNGGGTDAPLVGPIQPAGPVVAGTPVNFAATFSDRNSGGRYGGTWSWNDGCGADVSSKIRGPGTVRASHTFCAPGEYWITFKVTDGSGRGTTVGRYVMVDDAAAASPTVAGSGWFVSPRGAYRQQQTYSGPARFGFVAKKAGAAALHERKTTLRFHVANLTFESDACASLTMSAGRAQCKGVGTLNGAGNHQFLLEAADGAASGAASHGRLRMRIWHVDAGSKAEVVDYDNQGATASLAAGTEGSAVAAGNIVIHR